MQHQSSNFKSSNHNSELCRKLLSFSDDGKFSDICIIGSDDVRLHAHKCVLAALSEYFLAMFDGSLKEAKAFEVKINDINSVILKKILAFLYTGRIDLSNETIQDIMGAANYLQIQSLICECYIFLGTCLDAKNCLGIALFADQHGLIELSEKTSKFASTHFDDVSNGKEFLDLNENQVCAIISREDLSVTSEEKVFLSLVKWMEHDKPNRDMKALNLFSKVRYWLLSLEFIKQQRLKLPNQIEYLQIICTWLEWHSSPESRRPFKQLEFLKPEKKPQRLAIFGNDLKQTYDLNLNVWTCENISKFPCPTDGICVLNNKFMYTGYKNRLAYFDVQREKHIEIPLKIERIKFGSAVLNGEFYVVGGSINQYSYGWKWSRVAEKYNFSTGKWQDITPTEAIYSNPKVASANGLLYVVGDGCSNMECFNPDTNEWISKPFLECKKSYFGFTAVEDDLYVVGGSDVCNQKNYDEATNTVTTFNSRLDKWLPSKPMNIPRKNPQCTSLNNKLITIGGEDNTGTPLNLVQEYNPSSKLWRTLAPVADYKLFTKYAIARID